MSLRGDQTRFFAKLSAMMEAAVPLLKAFEVAAGGVTNPGFRAALERILSRAYGGNSLTESIATEGSIFSPEVMCLLRHGEETGDLEMKSAAIARGLRDGTFEEGQLSGGEAASALEVLIDEAVGEGATDVHVEPADGGAVVRLRVDGRLVTHRTLSHTETGVLLILAKRMADLDASEVARPQSGSFRHEGHLVCVATCGYAGGEGVVLRLDEDRPEPDLEALGLDAERAAEVRAWLEAGRGLILAASPVAGGRNRVVEALLFGLDREAGKVIVVDVEDRVRLDGVHRIRPEDVFETGEALRVALDQDPDAVAVLSEPDVDVAERAVGMALSGHLVILAVDGRGPAEALAAFASACPDPDALAEALRGVVATRALPRSDGPGRTTVFEVVTATPEIRGALRRGAESPALSGALPRDRRTLRAEAERLVGEGVVAAPEVERAFGG